MLSWRSKLKRESSADDSRLGRPTLGPGELPV